MGYYIDIENISLDDYKAILKDAYMIPSRAMLKEDIDANIDVFSSEGINNVAELQKFLKSKPKLKAIAEKTRLDEKYLNALRRVRIIRTRLGSN